MKMDVLRAQDESDGLATLIAREGSLTHGWVVALAGGGRPRDLSDAVHHILMLHGRHPGIFDHASLRPGLAQAVDWLSDAADEFASERSYFNRLAVAAGPLPSTPGQAECEAAMLAQCHAIEMLARSDRTGCALGAAIALALDWHAIRQVLDAAGARFGVAAPRPILTASPALAAARAVPPDSAADRAVRFGARQLLLQHRGLWDLLEARAAARCPA